MKNAKGLQKNGKQNPKSLGNHPRLTMACRVQAETPEKKQLILKDELNGSSGNPHRGSIARLPFT